jgi:hypothetical protein
MKKQWYIQETIYIFTSFFKLHFKLIKKYKMSG